jgi:hypothetical protein
LARELFAVMVCLIRQIREGPNEVGDNPEKCRVLRIHACGFRSSDDLHEESANEDEGDEQTQPDPEAMPPFTFCVHGLYRHA